MSNTNSTKSKNRIFVGNIEKRGWNVIKLKDIFLPFGPIEEVVLGREGTAFVIFKYDTDAIEAIENMNGADYENSFLRVETSKTSSEFKSFANEAVWGQTKLVQDDDE